MHTYSVEVLIHFRCGHCERWWSIASLDPNVVEKKLWYCPTCGKSDRTMSDEIDTSWTGLNQTMPDLDLLKRARLAAIRLRARNIEIPIAELIDDMADKIENTRLSLRLMTQYLDKEARESDANAERLEKLGIETHAAASRERAACFDLISAQLERVLRGGVDTDRLADETDIGHNHGEIR